METKETRQVDPEADLRESVERALATAWLLTRTAGNPPESGTTAGGGPTALFYIAADLERWLTTVRTADQLSPGGWVWSRHEDGGIQVEKIFGELTRSMGVTVMLEAAEERALEAAEEWATGTQWLIQRFVTEGF